MEAAPDIIDPDPAVVARWRQYWATRQVGDRNWLAVHYWPIAARVASRQARKWAAHFGGLAEAQAELQSRLAEPLLVVIDSYDPAGGSKSAAGWIYRQLGYRLLDCTRDEGPVSRLIYQRVRDYRQAADAYKKRHQREPDDVEELAEWLDFATTPASRYREALRAYRGSAVVSLSQLLGDQHRGSDQRGEGRAAALDSCLAAPELEDEDQLIDDFDALLDGLKPRMKTLFRLIYVAGYTMTAAGGLLGLTESRVSQLHTEAIERLRNRLIRRNGHASGSS